MKTFFEALPVIVVCLFVTLSGIYFLVQQKVKSDQGLIELTQKEALKNFEKQCVMYGTGKYDEKSGNFIFLRAEDIKAGK